MNLPSANGLVSSLGPVSVGCFVSSENQTGLPTSGAFMVDAGEVVETIVVSSDVQIGALKGSGPHPSPHCKNRGSRSLFAGTMEP